MVSQISNCITFVFNKCICILLICLALINWFEHTIYFNLIDSVLFYLILNIMCLNYNLFYLKWQCKASYLSSKKSYLMIKYIAILMHVLFFKLLAQTLSEAKKIILNYYNLVEIRWWR